jgi:hypothetical protein
LCAVLIIIFPIKLVLIDVVFNVTIHKLAYWGKGIPFY